MSPLVPARASGMHKTSGTSNCISAMIRVSKRGFPRAEISITGVVRAPVAVVNFAVFVGELLVESYINSEIFTGI